LHTADANEFHRDLRARAPRLIAEFNAAIVAMPETELKAWARSIPGYAATGARRRIGGLASLAKAVGSFSVREWNAGRQALAEERLGKHLHSRADEIAHSTVETLSTGRAVVEIYAERVVREPRREAPVLVAGLLGFMVGSGGLDGDGGIPDLDLLGGIGAHRSLLTHTFIAGVITETLILSLVDLVGRVHDYLPADRDSLWVHLDQRDSRVVEALVRGVSTGLAYHFAVDATVDSGGAYAAGKGILSPGADDALQAAMALAEGLHASSRRMTARRA
jgi:hypothetical protein